MDDRKAVLVTGVSTGIGKATAIHLVNQGFFVYGSVRKRKDGEQLKKEVDNPDLLEILIFDVTNYEEVNQNVQHIKDAGRGLYGIVNNAGIAIGGPMEHISINQIRDQMEVNFFAVVHLLQQTLKLIRESGGRVVQISSVSGQEAFAFYGPYAASKHALEAVTDSLRRELLNEDIMFSIIEPGVIDTPIWDKGVEMDLEPYKETSYYETMVELRDQIIADAKKEGLPPQKVADAIHHALTSNRPKARYLILPFVQKCGFKLKGLVPTSILDKLFSTSPF